MTSFPAIDYTFCLPVPDKAQVQHNYVLLLKDSYGLRPTEWEPLVFTINAGAPKPDALSGLDASMARQTASDSFQALFDWALPKYLATAGNPSNRVLRADPARFHSKQRQAHRPQEKAVHVGAHRGSKDGYLFFLEQGILWGYKKPVIFLPLDRIASVSYTRITNRTFDLVVEMFSPDGGDATDELDFAMVDQVDYAGIDEAYVRRHGLQDKSMAERRRAKRELAENAKDVGAKGAAANGDDTVMDPADGIEDEMAREQALQDEEDELEEDYNPSDGDSDGSGESSEEDEDGDDDGAEGGEEDDDDDEEEEEDDGEEA